eukprot:8841756-Karenia_brevis.AAC.1
MKGVGCGGGQAAHPTQQEIIDEALKRQLAQEGLQELKDRLTSLDRQIAAIKDLKDTRSLSVLASLNKEAKMVRHAITRLKPADQQITVLEAV